MTTSHPTMKNEPPPVGFDDLEAKRQGIADQSLEKKSKQVVVGVRNDLTRKNKTNQFRKVNAALANPNQKRE